MKNKLKLKELSESNLMLASLIQFKIFKSASAFNDYINSLKTSTKYFLVYNKNKPIGVTGFGSDEKNKEIAWVYWLGILPQFRKHGLGTILLNTTIELIKKEGFKFVRLFTSKKYNPDAQFLYKKVMDFEEPYLTEGKDYEHYVVFSKSLTIEPAPPFGNGNLNLKNDEANDSKAIDNFNKYLLSHCRNLKPETDLKKYKKFLKKDFVRDFPAFERKSYKTMLNLFINKKHIVTVLEHNNKFIAYAICFKPNSNKLCLLDYIATAPELRSLGIGKYILEKTCKTHKNLFLEIEPFNVYVLDDCLRRAKFYKTNNFAFPKIEINIAGTRYFTCTKFKNDFTPSETMKNIKSTYEELSNFLSSKDSRDYYDITPLTKKIEGFK